MLINKIIATFEFVDGCLALSILKRLQSPVNTAALITIFLQIFPGTNYSNWGLPFLGVNIIFLVKISFLVEKAWALVTNYIKLLSIRPFYNYVEKTPQFYRCLF